MGFRDGPHGMTESFNEALADGAKELEHLIYPWLVKPSLSLIYAPRGLGKSYFAYYLSHRLACGQDCFGWIIEKPRRVIYFDAEMGRDHMINRGWHIERGLKNEHLDGLNTEDRLGLCSFDHTGGVMWNLADPVEQEYFTERSRGYDVIVIDNLLTCTAAINQGDGDVEQWKRVQTWALERRNAGQSVIFIHHSGKAGVQLGTSMRENIMNVIIALKRFKSGAVEQSEESPGFVLEFEKCRDYWGNCTEPLYVSFNITENALSFKFKPLKDEMLNIVRQVYERVNSWPKTAQVLDMEYSKLYKYQVRIEDEQDIVKKYDAI